MKQRDSLPLVALLTLSGGLMDAYSFIGRGGVFANAQTGNIVLLGISLFGRDFAAALRYLLPVLAFALGVTVATVAEYRMGGSGAGWRWAILLFEAGLFLCVAFLPQQHNLIANSLISLACGAQVESFRNPMGHSIATTMCIGNLRLAVTSLHEYSRARTRAALARSALAFGVIVVFAAGAVLGNIFFSLLGEKAILISAGLMVVAACILPARSKTID